MTHTPGPWRHDEASSAVVADALEGTYSNCVASYVRDVDAHLIAAAPTMAGFIKRKADEGDAEAASIMEAINGAA